MSDLAMIVEPDTSSCSSSVTGSSNDEPKSSYFPKLNSNDVHEVKNESEVVSFDRHRYKYLIEPFIRTFGIFENLRFLIHRCIVFYNS